MLTFKNKKSRSLFNLIMSIVGIILAATIISFIINGPKIFTSFHNYINPTGLGFAYGFAFGFGHLLINDYTKKLNWTKNLKRANVVSLSMYIVYGIIVCIMVPYLYDRFVWNMSGHDLFTDVSIKALIGMVLDLIFISIYYSTNLTKYWKSAIEKNEELKRENLVAKFEALKNQVNPHFLFNSLNTLTGVVEQKPELSTSFIKKLSDIYRYVLEQSDQETVPISKEMKFVDDYIFLLKMRFGEALKFNSNLSNENKIQVVPLGLQILVENAMKHNIVSDDLPLKIEIYIEDTSLTVKNNLQKKKTVITEKEPLGLENLRKRYEYLSNTSIEIITSESDFIVKLPLIGA